MWTIIDDGGPDEKEGFDGSLKDARLGMSGKVAAP